MLKYIVFFFYSSISFFYRFSKKSYLNAYLVVCILPVICFFSRIVFVNIIIASGPNITVKEVIQKILCKLNIYYIYNFDHDTMNPFE